MTVLSYFSYPMPKLKFNDRIVISGDQKTMSIGEERTANPSTSNTRSPPASTSRGDTSSMSSKQQQKPGKRPGRKPSKINERDKLERSRQSARECRARKKLRYQYLEELVMNREKAVFALRDELKLYKQWCEQLDAGQVPDALLKMIASDDLRDTKRQTANTERALGEQHKQQSRVTTFSTSSSSSSPTLQESSPPFAQSKSVSPPVTSLQAMPSPPQTSVNITVSSALRPPTLGLKSSPTGLDIEHLLPKLSPTQPLDQQQQPKPQPTSYVSSSTSTTTPPLKRQLAFDMSQQHPTQQAHTVVQRPLKLESQLSIPETVSSFILSSTLGNTSNNFSYTAQHFLEQFSQNNQEAQTCSTENRSSPPSQSIPPNFLHVSAASTGSLAPQRNGLMAKARSEPAPSDIIVSSAPSMHSLGIPPIISPRATGSDTAFFSQRDTSRGRSLSNPPSMYSAQVRGLQTQIQNHSSTRQISSSVSSTPMPFSNHRFPIGHNNVGFFSANQKRILQTLSTGGNRTSSGPSFGFFNDHLMTTSADSVSQTQAVESDSPVSSSDETVNESDLFRSSSTLSPQKRTLSDPTLHAGLKVRRIEGQSQRQLDQEQPSISAVTTASPFFSLSADDSLLSFDDPRTELKKLTTVRCFSSTRTSNTPSPSSSFGLVPIGVNSPSPTPTCSSRSGSFSRSSPAPNPASFSASNSPAPPMSISSVASLPSLPPSTLPSLPSLSDLDDFTTMLSPASSAAVDTALDIFTSASGAAPFTGSGSSPACAAGLQASIPQQIPDLQQQIPDLFSTYLGEFQQEQAESCSDRSTLNTPLLTPSQSQTDLNVPNIDDLLGDRAGIQ